MTVITEEHPLPPDFEEPPKVELDLSDVQNSTSSMPPTQPPTGEP